MNVTKVEPSMAPTVASSSAMNPPERGKAEGDGGVPQAAEAMRGGGDKVAAASAAQKSPGSLPRGHHTRKLDIEEVVRKANEALAAFDATGLKLLYDRQRELVKIQVLKPADKPEEKDKVIRQIPPEEFLKLADRLHELRGLLFDREV